MRVAVAGATGFIGQHVVKALVTAKADVVGMVHERPAMKDGVRWIRGDLVSDAGLSELVRDAEILIHCASYVGSEEILQQQVNVEGTERLLAAARRAGVQRVVYLSTAGVYGGLGTGGTEETLRPAPTSSLSRSRLAAEQFVLDTGGTVVRPNAVVGAGDRWYLTQLLALMLGYGIWIEEGTPTVSVIEASLLGQVLASLALDPGNRGVYHAASPDPVTIRALVSPVLVELGALPPKRSLSGGQVREFAAKLGISPSQLRMVAEDNVFETNRLWAHLPGLARAVHLSHNDVAWYAQALKGAIARQ